jgi:hypothetical protein
VTVVPTSIPPDWYADPHGAPQLRYWDGERWTEHVSPVPSPAVDASAAPEPARKRRGPLVPLLVSAGIVVVLGVATAFAWGPVSALLFPIYTLAQSSAYQSAVEALERAAPEPVDPIAYPQWGAYLDRRSPGYLRAATSYVDTYLAEYAAENAGREFDSKRAMDSFAFDHTSPDLADVGYRLKAGGQGLEVGAVGYPQVAEILAVEQQVAAVPVVPGADGSYWDAAQQVVGTFGAALTEDTSSHACLSIPSEDTAAFVCNVPENWTQVYVTPWGMSGVDEPRFVDMAKHELSHKLIYAQCAGALDTHQAAWDDRIGEGVTNSYAVLFLGASREALQVDEGEYRMTDETDAQARAVHESDLACFDGGQLPPYDAP